MKNNPLHALMMLNVQGLTPDTTSVQYWKHDYLANYICTSDLYYPFIALTETWLKPKHSDTQVEINNYQVRRSDRIHREHGGALLYVHKSIAITSTDIFDDDICQAVLIKSSPIKLIVACVYKPCDASDNSFTNVLAFLQESINNTPNSDEYTKIVLGDFNFPDLYKSDSEYAIAKSVSEKALMSFMSKNFLCQYINVGTRNNNILDLMLCSNDRLTQHIVSKKHEISDHNVIEILIPPNEVFPHKDTLHRHSKPELHHFNALDLFNADFVEISKELKNVNWDDLWNNSTVEEFPEVLQSVVLEACKKHAPQKVPSKSNRLSSHQRSYHKLLRKKRKLKTRLDCLNVLKPSSPLINSLKLQINQIFLELKDLSYTKQQRAEQKAIDKIKTNPKYFYSYAKRLAKTKYGITQLFKNDKEVITDRKEIADALQDQFSSTFSNPQNQDKQMPTSREPSVTLANIKFTINDIIKATDEIPIHSSCPDSSIPAIVLKKCKFELAKPLFLMWETSFRSGTVPPMYKQQLVTPVFKKGSRSLPPNYRPISLTAHEVKIFERVLRSKMVDFLESHNLLSCKQHGFRKGKSCLSQLLKQYDDILKNLLNHTETDVIYLDFAKAFDKVDHEILLQKLKNIGISGTLLLWISDFLSNRSQVVVVDGIFSYLAKVVSGVPQGTVLGPLLFLVYINDIGSCLTSCDISCFADDSRIFKSISYSTDANLLQLDLLAVSKWSDENNMKLHSDKFVFVNFNNRRANFSLANLPFYKDNLFYTTSNGPILETSDSVSDLGVTFSEDLSWTFHISSIVKKARQKAGWVLSSFKDRSRLAMITPYKSLIRSLLEYCCPLWMGLNVNNIIRELESVQRSFTNKIKCPPSITNYWERLRHLHLMSLQRRRERYAILHVWKIVNGLVSNDLNMIFYDSPRFGITARIPSINRKHNQKARSLYDSSFSVLAPL